MGDVTWMIIRYIQRTPGFLHDDDEDDADDNDADDVEVDDEYGDIVGDGGESIVNDDAWWSDNDDYYMLVDMEPP